MNDSQQTLEDSVRPIVSAPDFHAQEDREEDDTDIAAPYPAGTYIFVPDLKPLCVYDVTIEIDPPVLHEPMAPEWGQWHRSILGAGVGPAPSEKLKVALYQMTVT